MEAKDRRQPVRKRLCRDNYLDRGDKILNCFFKEIIKYDVYGYDEVKRLIVLAQRGNEDARRMAIESNYRLLVRIAREFMSNTVSINDLIQEGYFGLVEAVDKYDVKRGTSFANFASWWIRMHVMRYILWHQSAVRIPISQRSCSNKLMRISSRFMVENYRFPNDAELQELSGLPERVVADFCSLFNYGLYRGPVEVEDENIISDLDGTPKSSVEESDEELMHEAIAKCIGTLTKEQQEFLKDYYGIGRPAIPTVELAKRRHTTTENIRQYRARLVKLLRKNCHGALRPYAEDLDLISK